MPSYFDPTLSLSLTEMCRVSNVMKVKAFLESRKLTQPLLMGSRCVHRHLVEEVQLIEKKPGATCLVQSGFY